MASVSTRVAVSRTCKCRPQPDQLLAEPCVVAFDVERCVASATLSIRNARTCNEQAECAGSFPLHWTASTDAEWVELSPGEQFTPSELTLRIARTVAGGSIPAPAGVTIRRDDGGELFCSVELTGGQVSRPGDCDGTMDVAINELVLCVRITLGSQPVAGCRPCDRNGNARIEINELIQAVNAALSPCSPAAGLRTADEHR
jgi:hypothetical protein